MSNDTPIIIRKYPNRRLYNTETSKYITIDDLAVMVKQGKEFKVIDVKSNEDLTRVTLAQIILDHEMKGYELLPLEVLKQIIKLYDHPLSKTFSNYLLGSFAQWSNQMEHIKDNLSHMQMPFANPDWQNVIDDFNKQNQEFFEKIVKSFSTKK